VEAFNPGSVIGTAVIVLAVVAFILVVVWMPIQIRKEQREIEAKRLEPIHTTLAADSESGEDAASRQALVRTLSPETKVVLKRINPDEPGYPGVGVCLEDGTAIGQLPPDPGTALSRELGLGHAIDVSISSVRSGADDEPECTVELIVQRRPSSK
jgi:hypothetical protein